MAGSSVLGALLLAALCAAKCADKPTPRQLELLKMEGTWYVLKHTNGLEKYSCGEVLVHAGFNNSVSWSVRYFDSTRNKWDGFSGQATKSSGKEGKLKASFWKPANSDDMFSELVQHNLDTWLLNKKYNDWAVLRTCREDSDSEFYLVLSRRRGLITNEDVTAKFTQGDMTDAKQDNCDTYKTFGGL
ncbi:uncharacterized protein LOC134541483 [Bacillus rossius redtenbacheri]|uniref:uncharacterized protein LOC134541483 n=1 Tax=Bacillus rossius redtenbacheri TaxID=93214 RepID=UPI002FDEAEF3